MKQMWQSTNWGALKLGEQMILYSNVSSLMLWKSHFLIASTFIHLKFFFLDKIQHILHSSSHCYSLYLKKPWNDPPYVYQQILIFHTHLFECLFFAVCRKIFKLWFLRYKRKVIHRHLCKALAKKVERLFKLWKKIDTSVCSVPVCSKVD